MQIAIDPAHCQQPGMLAMGTLERAATGNLEKAALGFEDTINNGDASPEMLFQLGVIYRQLRRTGEAIKILGEHINRFGSSPSVLLFLGLSLWDTGNSAQAGHVWQQALNDSSAGSGLNPDGKNLAQGMLHEAHSIESRLSIARRALAEGRLYDAWSQVQRVLTMNQLQPQALAMRDQLYYGSAYPRQVTIEPTNSCVINCPGCGGRGGKIGYMPLSEFEKIMAELGPQISQLWLHNRGESFRHPDIYRMLDIVGRYPKVGTVIHTSGSQPLDAQAIVKSGGLHQLVFSIDGATPDTYGAYRRNGDMAMAFQNIRDIQEAKKRLGAQYPKVIWKFIVMKTNEHQMDLARQMAKDLGVDELLFAPFSVGWAALRQLGDEFHSYIERFVPTDLSYLNGDYDKLMQGVIRGRGTPVDAHCFSISQVSPGIRWDGSVVPCCSCIPPHDHVMGNVFEGQSFKEIWDSAPYRRFRRQAVEDPLKMKPCTMCRRVS